MFKVSDEETMKKEELGMWLNAISDPTTAAAPSPQQSEQQQRSSLTSHSSPFYPFPNGGFTFWGGDDEIVTNSHHTTATIQNDTVLELSRDLSAMRFLDDDHRRQGFNNNPITRPQPYAAAGANFINTTTNPYRSFGAHAYNNVVVSPRQETVTLSSPRRRHDCIGNSITRTPIKSTTPWRGVSVSDANWGGIIPNGQPFEMDHPQSSSISAMMMNLGGNNINAPLPPYGRGCGGGGGANIRRMTGGVAAAAFAPSFPNYGYDFDYMCSARGPSAASLPDISDAPSPSFMFSPTMQLQQPPNLNNAPSSNRFRGFQNLSPRPENPPQPMAFKCDNSYIFQDHRNKEMMKRGVGGGCTSIRGGSRTRRNCCQQEEVDEEEEEEEDFTVPFPLPIISSSRASSDDDPAQKLLQMLLSSGGGSHLDENGVSVDSMYSLARDQNGCRLLQKIIDEGGSGEMEFVFKGIIDNVVELMTDPFGNYLVQKLLDLCRDDQRLKIVEMLTDQPGKLVQTSLNTHGTRVVQKLISTLKSRKQISLVRSAIQTCFLQLIKDLNGNHVIQRCLQSLSVHDNEFIFDAATKFLVDIATHQHGCCVLQRCIDYSTGKSQDKLFKEICKHGLNLAQDPFGNYVVQYVIEKENPSATFKLTAQFKGNYVALSMQKFSSHVVEKCLQHVAETRSRIVQELLSVEHFEQLLQDPFANYVVQRAISVTKGTLHASLVAAVRPHRTLRNSPYCKRLFTKNMLKN